MPSYGKHRHIIKITRDGGIELNIKKLETKDLISTGVFTAIYFTIMFSVGMLGYVPVLYVILPILIPMACGIPFMLFLTRVKSFGMTTIMGSICGTMMFITGHTYIPILFGFGFGMLADILLLMGKYKSRKLSALSYATFSLWMTGMLLPFWIMRDSFEGKMIDNMGTEYASTVIGIFEKTIWLFPPMAFIAGIIGAIFGIKMLDKHFKKAGII